MLKRHTLLYKAREPCLQTPGVKGRPVSMWEQVTSGRVLCWPGRWPFFGGVGCLECLSVLQMKMPSKKFAHIPVYTLGFESPQRMSTAKTTPTQRRDAFQCVLPLVMFLVGRELGGGFSAGEGGGQSAQSPESQFFQRKGFCGVALLCLAWV